MSTIGSDTILATFVLFCRIGACLMLMPGFSSDRVPVQMRLFLAITVTLALAPVLIAEVAPAIDGNSPVTIVRLVVSELLIGSVIGLLGRFFFLALETLTTAIAMTVGLGNALMPNIETSDVTPPLVSFVMLAATFLFFATDQHVEVLRALNDSYNALKVSAGFSVRPSLVELADIIAKTFSLTLRISSPFIIFGIIVNVAIGLANKLTPQVPLYFISAPFVLAGGLVLLYFVCKPFFELFIAGFGAWLRAG